MNEILMPHLSDSMDEGTILKWLKSVGDEVAVGEELVEIETDKANMVYESDVAGTLIEILAAEDSTLPIGAVIARVGEPGESPSRDEAASTEFEDRGLERAAPAPKLHAPMATEESAAAPIGAGRVKASPVARRIAKERGLDLAALQGSGPGGRIIKADVENVGVARPEAPGAPAAHPVPDAREHSETAKGSAEIVELTKLQKTVVRRTAESKATTPHFYLEAEIDMSRCFDARMQIRATARDGDIAPSFNDMVVKACAIALREFPRANGSYRDGQFELHSRINIGIAVAAQDALVVPTIFDADRKGLRAIAMEARELAEKVREGRVTPPELAGGTFTVSNLGMFGVSNFHPVINLPQSAILAVGEIRETPVIRGDEVTAGRVVSVTLACDHRILYGAEGAQFLARVKALLEEPTGLAAMSHG